MNFPNSLKLIKSQFAIAMELLFGIPTFTFNNTFQLLLLFVPRYAYNVSTHTDKTWQQKKTYDRMIVSIFFFHAFLWMFPHIAGDKVKMQL